LTSRPIHLKVLKTKKLQESSISNSEILLNPIWHDLLEIIYNKMWFTKHDSYVKESPAKIPGVILGAQKSFLEDWSIRFKLQK
jgi:hypothetical protein